MFTRPRGVEPAIRRGRLGCSHTLPALDAGARNLIADLAMHPQQQPSPFILNPIPDLRLRENSAGDGGRVVLVGDDAHVAIRALEGGIFELTINRNAAPIPRFAPPLAAIPAADRNVQVESDERGLRLTASAGASLTITTDRLTLGLEWNDAPGNGVPLIPLHSSQIIGLSGEACGLALPLAPETPFYGFGEKTGPLNKNGRRMKFWNLDVCADLPDSFRLDDYDPTYCAIPLALWPARSESGHTGWAAVLIDNSGPSWFNCQTRDFALPESLYFGTYCGEARFYFITGATLGEVCAKVLRLTGTPPLPPLWSLGNHQCRWGYDSQRVYRQIVEGFIEHDIPLHGFWLDIDYMDRYRVFTWDAKRVPSPERLAAWMDERGVRLVTIIDPGVAIDESDPTYRAGVEADLFCRSPSGRHFVGMVWPGRCVFPDFSLPETRAWWSQLVAKHLSRGVSGIWNDMNDPAAGKADVQDMLFSRGAVEHRHLHNLYGTFMAEATHDGFSHHDPNTRHFLLTRSASTGIQRFAAVWTGDNASNWSHLRMSIPETLNLALSGVSFNGADIGGFMDDATAELLTRWYQAALLFPFYRNHSHVECIDQEPWRFGRRTCAIIRETINLRYRLLGALYTEFARHILTGEPMVRPMCFFSNHRKYRDIADAYALGENIIVAPVVHQGAAKREILLPPGQWFDVGAGRWVKGGVRFERPAAIDEVPLFVRRGTIICEPMPASGAFLGWDCDLTRVRWRLHCFGPTARGEQIIDDGLTQCDDPPLPLCVQLHRGSVSGDFPLDRIGEIILHGASTRAIAIAVGGRRRLQRVSASRTRSARRTRPRGGDAAARDSHAFREVWTLVADAIPRLRTRFRG